MAEAAATNRTISKDDCLSNSFQHLDRIKNVLNLMNLFVKKKFIKTFHLNWNQIPKLKQIIAQRVIECPIGILIRITQ